MAATTVTVPRSHEVQKARYASRVTRWMARLGMGVTVKPCETKAGMIWLRLSVENDHSTLGPVFDVKRTADSDHPGTWLTVTHVGSNVCTCCAPPRAATKPGRIRRTAWASLTSRTAKGHDALALVAPIRHPPTQRIETWWQHHPSAFSTGT